MKGEKISVLEERKKQLKFSISSMKSSKDPIYSDKVINEYKSQLEEVELELKKDREKNKEKEE